MHDIVADRWADAKILENPFDYLAELRREAPVYFAPSLGAYMVTRYKDVSEVLRNAESFASNLDGKGEAQANFSAAYAYIYEEIGVPPLLPTLQSSDGAVHRRYRQTVDSTFNANTVRGLEAEVRQRINALIDPFIDAGKVDIYAEFCMKLPLYLICDLAGIPHELTPLLRASADAMARLAIPAHETPESIAQLHRSQAEFQREIIAVIKQLRAYPDDKKLISRLIETPTNDGSYLTDQEIMSVITVINVGGNETTTNGLANMLHLCFSTPGYEAQLRDNRPQIDRFVEEALRVESPVACLPRRATRDVTIGDVTIPEGAIVMVNFASANRDETQYQCPHQIDTARSGVRNHMAFGAGVHFCLGAMLTRLEMIQAMNIILDRMENIRLDPEASEPRHEQKMVVRAFTALPVLFEDRAKHGQ